MIQKETTFGVKNNGFCISSQEDQGALGTFFLGSKPWQRFVRINYFRKYGGLRSFEPLVSSYGFF